MVYVEVVNIENGIMTASYAPGRKEAEKGVLVLDPETGERTVVKRSADDDMPASWYIGHAFREMERMASATPPAMSGMTAWY